MNYNKFTGDLSKNNNDIKKYISQPNSIISASNLPPHFSESDISSLFGHYGKVDKVQRLNDIGCFLISFSDLSIASAIVQMARFNQFTLGSFQITLDYAPTTITSPINETTAVISIVISNVKYPITVDIIKQICEKYGRILRIHIGKKNGNNVIESLVEFEKNSEAKYAKEKLHGEDIYSGCCSLEIKMSSISSITVLKNDEQTWDFTRNVAKPGILQIPTQQDNTNTTALKSESFNNNSFPIWPFSNVPPPMYPSYVPPITQIPQYSYPPIDVSPVYSYSPIPSKVKVDISKNAFIIEPGVVFMCYHVPFNVSVDHLFNIFCLYGNVNKIRFLVNQPQAVMVQMGSRKSSDLCIRHYNGMNFFSKEVKLSPCIKVEVFVPKKIDYLANGTPSFKDFSKDPNNRFLNEVAVANNKIYEPNRTLHFFNAPSTFREDDLANMLLQSGVPKPLSIIIFNTKNDNNKKCIGLFEFHRLDDAIVALSILNHKPIIIPDTNQTFHLKLTFSAREPNKVGSTKYESKRAISNENDDDFNQMLYKKMRYDNVTDDLLTSDHENEESLNLTDKSKILKDNIEISLNGVNIKEGTRIVKEEKSECIEENEECNKFSENQSVKSEKIDTKHLLDNFEEDIVQNDEYELSLEYDDVNNLSYAESRDSVLFNNVEEDKYKDIGRNDEIFTHSNNYGNNKAPSSPNLDESKVTSDSFLLISTNNGIIEEAKEFLNGINDSAIENNENYSQNSIINKESFEVRRNSIDPRDITKSIKENNQYNGNEDISVNCLDIETYMSENN